MGDKLNQLQVPLMNPGYSFISADVKNSFPGTILEDVGIQRPPKQDITALAVMIELSLETIPDLGGDVIFTLRLGGPERSHLRQASTQPPMVAARCGQAGQGVCG